MSGDALRAVLVSWETDIAEDEANGLPTETQRLCVKQLRAALTADAAPVGVGGADWRTRNNAFNLADTVMDRIECGDKQGARDAIMEAMVPSQVEAMNLPDDSTDGEVVEHFLHIARAMKPVGQWPGERVCIAIERLVSGPRGFIAAADRSPQRGHNGRGGDAKQPLAPFKPAALAVPDAEGRDDGSTDWGVREIGRLNRLFMDRHATEAAQRFDRYHEELAAARPQPEDRT